MPLGERSLIAELRRIAQSSPARRSRRGAETLRQGIGDDCAVLAIPPGHESLLTTDFSLEGVHFRREWHPPESVGHRCLTRGLSDVAAMGGAPIAAFLSLALPRDLRQSWVDRFTHGLLSLAESYGVVLGGGDTAESPAGVLADIVVLGSVPKGKAVLRSGARPGDSIVISGELGGSAAAIRRLMTGEKVRLRGYPRHFYPPARIALGQMLRQRKLATSMIDTSDGLSTDLSHICAESGVGAEMDTALIPRASVGWPSETVDLDLALHGGEDYELLFTAPAGKRIPPRLAGVRLTRIGLITRSPGIWLRDPSGARRKLEPKGWEHFSKA